MKANETDTGSSASPPLLLDGRYQIEDRLGGGGASDVYRARDLRLGRPVAVKMFRVRAGAHSDRRCGDEARLLAALNHPGLVAVYDAGWHDDREYLVLQLIEGRTLGRRIAAGALSPRDVVRIGAVLADVLHHVHARGIVHRDVKPSNVLCGSDGAVFLADFGISHPAGAEETNGSGVVVGTAPYLAPEQVQGGPVGPPCDVYALGLVLLECLTGKREYPGGQLEAAMARLHREPVVPDHTPAPLGRLIRAMTALDPASRPTALQCRKLLAVHDPNLSRPTFPVSPPVELPAADGNRWDSSDLPTAEVLVAAALEDEQAADVVPEPVGDADVGLDVLLSEAGAEEPSEEVAVEPSPQAETGHARRRRTTGAHRRRRGAGLGSTFWLSRGRESTPEARAS
ncbi:serine/threonine-protein kinase [Cryptosporangium aurantiacum]|uniref:non-specific serine/threonine protein kinase n=1 Tax=Cryptosporangium aurantiacum TaxID=134849 RepID=A0A1M7HR89_9ACTN|nr:serine/threonine-protein kinase [Cryptosporangium aurantiacum]SHM31072.1 Serine/threonine protein kinase [Cryptosporangium aurantiacum]